jgi:hypothetical protein
VSQPMAGVSSTASFARAMGALVVFSCSLVRSASSGRRSAFVGSREAVDRASTVSLCRDVYLDASRVPASDAGGLRSRWSSLWGRGGLRWPARAIVAANRGAKVAYCAVRRNV